LLCSHSDGSSLVNISSITNLDFLSSSWCWGFFLDFFDLLLLLLSLPFGNCNFFGGLSCNLILLRLFFLLNLLLFRNLFLVNTGFSFLVHKLDELEL
jgi:hypothetical protein